MDVTIDRHTGIGSSDANRLWKGDWTDLYLEKIGEKEPEDLSGNFKVQLGVFTEPFHIAWLRDHEGFDTITKPKERFTIDDPCPMFANLDGMIEGRGHVEAKHTNQFSSRDDLLEWYMPQLHHVMHVLGTEECLFSYIGGNDGPHYSWIRRNDDFMGELLEYESRFWEHVEGRIPPGTVETAPVMKHAFTIDEFKPYDFEGNNEWADLAHDFVENKEGALKFERAKKGLKKLVPDDASKVTGHGIIIQRSASGSLLFK